jgi:hypothetical protein
MTSREIQWRTVPGELVDGGLVDRHQRTSWVPPRVPLRRTGTPGAPGRALEAIEIGCVLVDDLVPYLGVDALEQLVHELP